MENFYINLNQLRQSNDGQTTVKRQSRLMSHQGKALRNVQMSRYCPQPDSVSNPCRCRVLATPRVFSAVFTARAWKYVAMIFAVLVMSVANIDMAWGTNYYVIPAKCNVSTGALVAGADGSTQLFKTDESTVTVNTDISTSITTAAGLYYNSTSTTYANLTKTSNYGTSQGSSRTMVGIKIQSSQNCTISVNSKRFSKLDVIYRCASSESKTLTIDGEECNTSDQNVHLKSITKDYSSNIIISNGSNKEYQIFIILTEASGGGGGGSCYSDLAYSGGASMPTGWTIVSNDSPKPQINDNTIAMQKGGSYAYSSGAPTRGMYFDADQNATISITSHCTNGRAFCLVEKNGGSYSIIQTWDDDETLTASIVSGRRYYLTSKAGSSDNAKCNITAMSFSDCADSNCPEAYSFTYKNTSTEWTDPICFTNTETSDGNGGYFWIAECTLPTDGVSFKLGWEGTDNADLAKTTEIDFTYMPYELQRTKTFGVHPTAENTGGAEGYLRVRSSYGDNNKYIGFIPSGYVLRTGSGESWTSTNFEPASEDYYEENWSTPLTTLSASTAAKHYYVGLKTSSGYVWSNAYSEDWSRLIFLQTKGSPTPGWRADNAKMQLHYWKNGGGGADAYVTMTDDDGDGVFEAWLPNANYDRVQFKRLNSSMSTTWNQTGDLELQADKNMYIIEEDFSQTGWGVYEQAGKFHIYASSTDKNWYLRFKPHYVLHYDANGGSGAPADASVASDAVPCQWTLSTTQPTWADHVFLGWSTNSSATAADADAEVADLGSPYPASSDVTLYAVWQACSGPNGGSATYTAAGYTYDLNATANTMSLTGVTASNGGALSYQWYKTTSDVAHGEAISGATSNTYTPATDVAHAANWYYFCRVTEAGCSTTYTSGLSGAIVVNEAATLYTVTYNVNGAGSVTPASATQASADAAITLATPTWSGYTFEGWYNAGTKIGNGGASYTPTADITLYAHWTDNISGKVFSFIDNNYGDKFKAFDLSGWVTGNADNKDKTHTNATTGVSYVIDDATWENKSMAVAALAKFKGGTTKMSVVIPTGKIATVKISYGAYGTGDDYRLTVNSTAQANPTTKLTNEMTNAQVIASMKEITLSSQTGTLTLGISNTSKSLYIGRVSAVITGYTVSYDKGSADGASGSLASGTKTAGSSFTLSSSSSAFTRSGYTYDGWSVNEDGSTKDYNLGGSYTTDAPVTLYPHWVADASATITATLLTPAYMRTGASGVQIGVEITGASTGWYYRVRKGGGYETPDNTTYTTTTWTMTSTIGDGANTYTVELYNGSGTKMAESNAVEVTGETGHPMTIAAGEGGSASPASTWANGDHLQPEITATPSSGYHFVNWTKNNENATLENANAATTTITSASGACTITANFAADVVGYTVTYKYNGATSGASPTSATGASVTLPSPTRTGYVLDGWYTTAGEKVEDGGATYEPEADITLYARWQKACDAGAGSVATFNFNSGSESGLTFAYENETKITGAIVNTKTNDIPVLDSYYYNVSYSGNSSGVAIITTNSAYSEIDSIKFNSAASGASDPKITIYGVKKNGNDSTALSSSILLYNGSANNAWRAMPYNLDIHGKSPKYSGKVRFKLTTGSSGKKAGIDNIQIFYGGGSGTCRHIYYHGNGATSGFVSDTTSYADDAKATVLGYNGSRYPLTKDSYDFQGWATSASGAVAYSAGEKITIDGADVHLYAVWATTRTALVNWTMKINTSDWTTTATSTTDDTNISSIGTARTAGSDGTREVATAKVTMATAEVTGSAAPSNSANFTFTIVGGKQVEISKFDCQVFNVNSGSRTYKAQISDAAGNVYNSTNIVAVSTEATLTDASFVFGSGKILRGAVTIRVYAWGSGSEFRMGPDVKFYGTVDDYACADPSAPTISGVSEYVPGQTITLTATHDGENYDNLTTYTWYKGADWTTASGTTPVQAAATGESGYTLTIADCTTGDAGLYWCEAANGTCTAHSAAGYDVTVFPAYTITYHLDDGSLDGTQKTSYTQFDEDYTLPTPTKTGYVFAGWYGASDFSGLPTVVLGSGSVGNKEYWAKWGAVVTVSWTVDDDLYRGGGDYSVKAVIDQTTWDESYKDQLELTATEGVTLKNIVASVVSSHVQVTADFDITTGLAADATEITFTLSVPANGTYGPKVDEHVEALTSCAGSSTTITIFDGATMSDKTDADDISYKSGTEYTDGTTGFKYKCAGFKKDLVDVTEYTNHGSYSNAMKYGGNSTSYYISMTIPTGYTGSMEIVYGSTDKTRYFAFGTSNSSTANGSNGTKWNATTAAATTLYSATIDDLAAGTYYLLATGDKAIVAKIAMTLYATGGGITPTLTWDDGDADIAKDGVSKSTSDNDFIYTARQNKNSLGAITYSSSEATVATVNSTTGQVHLVGAAGTATITATIAASGCFSSANVSYTITVTDDCDDEAGTIETEDLGCSGVKMTVTGHTAAAGVIYQWYKVGTPSDTQVGTNQDNFTATEAGSYYVIVTNTGDRHCAKRSTNTITVEAQAAATVTKIVDSWYVKKDRRTPDIELVKTTNATSFTVKIGSTVIWNSDSTNTTGFAGCGFHMGENGIIYLNGTKDNGDAPAHDDGTWAAGDETLTITAIGCGGNASQNITIHRQAATNHKEIAFVADGGKGMKKDSITVGHGDGSELYEYLDSVGTAAGKRLFQLSERNIYWTTDEKAIREEYSQFDAILITDDPSTNTVVKTGDDYKTKGYVNAFGTMVDVRPIFTMEAYVSALKNWGAKGIAGNPQSPNPRQYEMRLECKDHEIYGSGLPDPSDGTNVWEETIGDETFRHVILVDSTKGIYNGVAYNAQTAGKEKPALQGFTGEAAGSLLGLGRISNGSLQAAIERQEEPAARLLVMGINAKALQPTCALTNEGKVVIRNILTYLLKTNMEEVDDCSNYFTGEIDSDWSKAGNWSKDALPSSEAKVRILAPCVISGVQPHVAQVAIVSSGESGIRGSHRSGEKTCNGKLTINANGALIVGGKVLAAEAPHFAHNDLMPTTVEDLIINTNGSGQAALIFDNEEGDTKATVNLYSLGRRPSSYQYQYFAVPMEVVPVNPTFANETHGGTGIYTYVYEEATSGWTRRKYYDDLFAFEGLGITTKSTVAMEYEMTGNLASTATKEITLTHNGRGLNLIGNSWMAPIQIAALAEDNADLDNKTAYIYCAGRDAVEGAATEGDAATETAGQWIPIPFEASGTAGWREAGKLSVIPAMQAFEIKVSDEATLTLDYKKVVRGSTNDLNAKLRAPGRRMAANEVTMTNIRVADSKTHTDLSLFEGDRFSEAFDNGWEAEYMNGDGRSAKLYAETEAGQMAVAAMYDYEGTVVGFAPGKETEYTFSFMGEDNGYYLNDIKLQNSVRIREGETYTFTFEEGDAANRFYISRTAINAPAVATGMENLDAAAPRAQKIIYNDKLYIIRGGRLYDATGKVVK